MDTIGVNLKAVLLEAFAAATELLPPTLREKFVLIGGTSMLSLGGSRKTEDVDIAVTAEALDAFQEAAILDPRFSQDAMLSWTYTGNTPETRGITVTLEFLAMGGGFVPEIRAARPIALGGFRAGLAELIVMKARTLDSRDEARDARDLRFLLEKMEGSDENFRDVELEEEDQEIMEDMVRRLGGRYPALLQTLLHRT
jgi:Nucleotidyl transferase AbiEii toxin, Type IV TA system